VEYSQLALAIGLHELSYSLKARTPQARNSCRRKQRRLNATAPVNSAVEAPRLSLEVVMDESEHIFVSPHRDDVCFSMGGLAAAVGGHLINVFTQSQYTVGTENDFSLSTVQWVTQVRRQEDWAFIQECRLRETDLQWPEAPLRGYAPFDGHERDGEASKLEPELVRTLDTLGNTLGARSLWLFAPMAIGHHRDHLIVRDIVLRNIEHLQQRYHIAFYEDLHYASRREHRIHGIDDFVTATAGAFSRTVLPLGELAARKLFLIQRYASQFETLPTGLEQFTPADAESRPHEAIWSRETYPQRLSA